MKKIKKFGRLRSVHALGLTVVFFALIHLVILFYAAFVQQKLELLHMYVIMDVQYIYPNIDVSMKTFGFGLFVVVLIYSFMYRLLRKK